MANKAADAEIGKVYRPTRGAWPGEFYMRHPTPTATLIKRLEGRKNPLCRDVSLLAEMKRNPDWPVFYWHLRGTDPMTGNRYEVVRVHVVNPDYRLRQVKTRPGYR